MNRLERIMDELNISLYSTIDCAPMLELRNNKEYIQAPFVVNDIEKRINFKLYLEDCKTVLVVGIPHVTNTINENKKNFGSISASALKPDYHDVVHDKLKKIELALAEDYDNLKTKRYVDTGPLVDKIIGLKASLGYIAKNNLLLSNQYGTSFTIGYLLLNKDIEIKQEYELINQCKNCSKCLDNCPTGAIGKEHGYNYKICISYLTQKRQELTFKEREMIGNMFYGCDICQEVCPANKKTNIDDEYHKENSTVDLFKLIELSNKEIKKTYEAYGFNWLGPKILKRNALINIGNFKEKSNFDRLTNFLKHPSDTVKKYSLWALVMSDKIRSIEFLKALKNKTQNEIIAHEINKINKFYKLF